MAAMKKEIPFLFVFYFISSCIYIQNQKLKKIEYPETPYFLGFVPGQVEVNPSYSKDWCNKYCEEINKIANSLPEGYFLEILGKVDGTETLENRLKLSLGRAKSIEQLLISYGILPAKVKAIADPEPNVYPGKDLFDPENRKILFRIQKK